MKKKTNKTTRPYRRLKERLKLIRDIDRAIALGIPARQVMRGLGISSASTLTNWRRERRETRGR